MNITDSTISLQSLQIPCTQIRWIKLAVLSLAISGIYSIVLVLMRTPVITTIIGYDNDFQQQLFRTALIIHVDLSVVVWMLSMACFTWQYAVNRNQFFLNVAYYLFVLGLLILSFSPLFGGQPNLNNYVPILDNIVFITGIALILCASLIMSFSVLLFAHTLCIENISGAIIFVGATLSFVLSVPVAELMLHGSILDRHDYYEMLFWGPGHILQFLYVHLALVAWRILTPSKQYNNSYDFVLMLNSVFGISGIACHFLVSGDESFLVIKDFFTEHMRYFGGIAPTLAAIIIVTKYWRNGFSYKRLNCAVISSSFILFFSGGGIALMISGYNVTIPAHYHGSVVGISIALMGWVYHTLLQSTDIELVKRATQQIYLYMIGQMMHIIGLCISGGYGALRKTPGDDFPIHIKASMGLMGLGGMIAIIGGLMFVVICARKLSAFMRHNNSIYDK